MFNTKFIKVHVADELKRRLGPNWFDASKRKLTISNRDNRTDFKIEMDVDPEYRLGSYHPDIIFIIKWERFRREWKKFIDLYEIENPPEIKVRRIPHDFLYISCRKVALNYDKSRDYLYVTDESDLELFIERCVSDLNGEVGAWVRSWFDWDSALKTMDNDLQLCGTWRNSAYFWLVLQLKGPERACSFIENARREKWPQFQASQLEYISKYVCISDN